MARTIQVGKPGARMSRLRRFAQNHLGVKMTDDLQTTQIFRKPELDILDQYYEKTQYDHLQDWDDACASTEYIQIRKRKPRINYNLAKVLVDKVASKLIGEQTFPQFTVEDDPDDTQFFRAVQRAVSYRRSLIDVVKHTLISGACFARYFIINGIPKIEWVNAKYSYPQFDDAGNLEQVEIKYVYEDPNAKEANGKVKCFWYRMLLTKTSDILYDNPEYKPGSEPEFKVVSQADHNLGWVQGEWFRTEEDKFDPDGWGLFSDILDFVDDLNYSLSQTSQAVQYNQEPQLGLNGMDSEDIDNLIKSSQKGWNLGKEGKAEYIETDLKGVEQAGEQRDGNRNLMLDVVRVVLHDPEKMATAQSGKALETLHTPLVELVDELRAVLEPYLKNLLMKIGLTLLEMNARGLETVLQVPNGYVPTSLDVNVQWPAIFPPTIQDILVMTQAATAATTAKILSRESATRYIAQLFNVEDIDAELEKIAAEPDLNPFGSFGGDGGQQ